jgi:hypothetical protein
MQHQGENHRLTLCKVLNMSLLDATSLRTFSNNSRFDDVSPLTFDVSPVFDNVSSAFEDVRPSTFDVSSAFEDVRPLTFNVSMAFDDVSPLTFDLSSSFDDVSPLTFDVSLAFDDWSARMSSACPFIFPRNSCRSDSIALLCGVAVSGSGLVSVRRPIPCGFEGTVCGWCTEQDGLTRPPLTN